MPKAYLSNVRELARKKKITARRAVGSRAGQAWAVFFVAVVVAAVGKREMVWGARSQLLSFCVFFPLSRREWWLWGWRWGCSEEKSVKQNRQQTCVGVDFLLFSFISVIRALKKTLFVWRLCYFVVENCEAWLTNWVFKRIGFGLVWFGFFWWRIRSEPWSSVRVWFFGNGIGDHGRRKRGREGGRATCGLEFEATS